MNIFFLDTSYLCVIFCGVICCFCSFVIVFHAFLDSFMGYILHSRYCSLLFNRRKWCFTRMALMSLVTFEFRAKSSSSLEVNACCGCYYYSRVAIILPVVSSLKNNQVDRVKTQRKFVTVVILQFLCNTTSTRSTTTGRWQPRLWRPQQQQRQRHPWTSVLHPWYHRYYNHSYPWFYHHRKHMSMRINNVPYRIMVVNMISIPLMWV